MNNDAFKQGSPPVFCPLSSTVADLDEGVRAETREWADKFQLCADSDHAHSATQTGLAFTRYMMPDIRPDRISALACYNVWGFLLDDRVESPDLAGDLPRLLRWLSVLVRICDEPASWVSGDDTFLDAWQDINYRLAAAASPEQMYRFRAGFQRWMHHYGIEAAHTIDHIVPEMDSFLRLRIEFVGGENFVAEVELAHDLDVSGGVRELPAVRAARRAAILVAALDNDRASLAVHQPQTAVGFDIYQVLCHHDPSLDFDQALIEAVAIRDRCLRVYLNLREQILATAAPELRQHFDVLDTMISGNIRFHQKALRYLTPDAHQPPPWTDQPSDPDPTPLPYPSIRWWWDYLTT